MNIYYKQITTKKFSSTRSKTILCKYCTTYSKKISNPPLTHISTDPLYQMNQHTTYNPTTISQPINTVQPVIPPPQYIPIQQDTFINTSASAPEPMKPFDGLGHSYTPEEYLQQVEARLTFAIGEEPQNNPAKYRSWHNRRMAYIQCSSIGTALDWYTNLHISYKQQWKSFVQLFKKQFSSQKTAYRFLPTFRVIAKQLNLNVPKNIENKRAKIITVANQIEVPTMHYISMTCFTEVNHQN